MKEVIVIVATIILGVWLSTTFFTSETGLQVQGNAALDKANSSLGEVTGETD